MKSKRLGIKTAIYAVLLVALMVMAYTPALPAKAAAGVTVVTETVTVNNDIYFYVNLTYLRNTLGWVGSGVDIYVSADPYAVISPTDYRLVTGVYIVGYDYIAGTLYINDTVVESVLGSLRSDYLYIKVTDGSNVVTSNRFYIVTNVSDIITTNTKLSYVPNNEAGTTNVLNFTMNLSSLGLTVDLTTLNITIDMTSLDNVQTMNLYTNSSTSTSGTSNVINLTTDSVTTDTVHLVGTLLDFPLQTYTNTTLVLGKPVNYAEFSFALEASGAPVNLTGNVVVVNNNEVVRSQVNYTLENVVLNIGSLDTTIDIYPSTEVVSTDPTITGGATELNPGDQVTIRVHQFLNNTDTLSVCFFESTSGSKIFQVDTTVTVNSTYGNATLTITLPEKPYGGLDYFVMVKQGTSFRGLPASDPGTGNITYLTVVPYLDIAVVQNNGTFKDFNTETNLVPGDYILVKGHGFLQENITLYIEGTTVPATELIVRLDSDGDTNITVNESGMFFAIAQIPSTVDITDTAYQIYAEGETLTNKGYSPLTYVFNLSGDYYKVFVNPVPKWIDLTVWNESSAFIDQVPVVNPAYPAETPWVDTLGGYTNFTVEVMGVNFTTGNVSLVNGTNIFPALSTTFTNGYFFGTVDVPVAPYGPYYAGAENGTVVFTGFEAKIFVNFTTRIIDPVALLFYNATNYTTVAYLGTPTNITVVGYGWPGNVNVTWTIVKEGLSTSYSENFTTNVNGTFTVETNISDYLNTNGGGKYYLTVYYNSTIQARFVIYYNITAPVTIEIHTGTLKVTYPGDTVDVYVIVYLGDELANGDDLYNASITVTVYYYNGTSLEKLVDRAPATYTGELGIWHYRFPVTADVKGDELLIKVEATIQPKFYMVPQSDMKFDSLTVAGGLEDYLTMIYNEIENVNENVNATRQAILDELSNLNLTLTAINGQLVVVSDTLNNDVVPALYLLQDMVDNLGLQINLVLANQAAIQDQITNAESNLTSQLGVLYLELVDVANGVSVLNIKVDNALNLLTTINATVGEIYNNTVEIYTELGTVYMNLATLINDLNASLSGLIIDESGAIQFVIETQAGNIISSINETRDLLCNGIRTNRELILASIANLSSNLTSYATSILADLGIIKSNLTKLDNIMGMITSAQGAITDAISTESTNIQNAITASEGRVRDDIQTTQQKIDNAKVEVMNLINQVNTSLQTSINNGFNDLSSQVSQLGDTLGTKLDNLQNTLTGQIQNLDQNLTTANQELKSRVTTISSLSTVVLLAAVIAVGWIFGRART